MAASKLHLGEISQGDRREEFLPRSLCNNRLALDRIGRSTSHVIATFETLGKRGIGFKSLRVPMFDTTSPTGEFLLTIFAGLAQLERRMISQRTKSALHAKKTRGEKLVRPVALTPSQIPEAIAMIDDRKGVRCPSL